MERSHIHHLSFPPPLSSHNTKNNQYVFDNEKYWQINYIFRNFKVDYSYFSYKNMNNLLTGKFDLPKVS